MKINCYQCHTEFELDERITVGRTEECPKCYASVRCCRMCTFYDSTAYNECREPTAERILDKTKPNFCDFYQLGKGDTYKDKKQDLLSAADALFKK